MPPLRTVDEAVEWLRKHFRAEEARGLDAVYEIELTGAGGGRLGLSIRGERARIESGPAAAADVRLRLPARDYFGILEGTENADLLYMAGRLEIDGDLSLAVKLRTLFRPRA